jgi:hypothetical protein
MMQAQTLAAYLRLRFHLFQIHFYRPDLDQQHAENVRSIIDALKCFLFICNFFVIIMLPFEGEGTWKMGGMNEIFFLGVHNFAKSNGSN